MYKDKIDAAFIRYATDILGETNTGLSGGQIVTHCNGYAVDFNVDIPITSSDFGQFGNIVPNKRTALYKNLMAFNGRQQFTIIKELCELPLFQENAQAQEVKKRLFERFPQFSSGPIYIEEHIPTGWERVDRSIEEMKMRLEVADTEEKFQAVGMLGRETLITIAQQVFDSSRHKTLDGVEASPTDAKRMLEAYLQYELKDSSNKAKKWAKSAVDLGNQLTHDRNATKRDTQICLIAVSSIASFIRAIDETSSDNSTFDDLEF